MKLTDYFKNLGRSVKINKDIFNVLTSLGQSPQRLMDKALLNFMKKNKEHFKDIPKK